MIGVVVVAVACSGPGKVPPDADALGCDGCSSEIVEDSGPVEDGSTTEVLDQGEETSADTTLCSPELCVVENLCTEAECAPDGSCQYVVQVGAQCDDEDPCTGMGTCDEEATCVAANICHENAQCLTSDGQNGCVCGEGYEGDGLSCVDTDECADGSHACPETASCSNTVGAYECDCLPGYTGDGMVCADINECFGAPWTFQVKDIYEGEDQFGYPLSSSPEQLQVFGAHLLFAAQDESGVELWRTDGTLEGTYLVKDINPGTNFSGATKSSNPRHMEVYQDRVFFAASGMGGVELWVSDGTSDGTTLFKDLYPGTGSNNSIQEGEPSHLTVYDGRLFFAADGPEGRELWVSDGTSEGTSLFLDIWPGSSPQGYIRDSNPADLTVVGDQLFFAATSDAGRELWVTDGTVEGTYEVADIHPGNNEQNLALSSNPSALVDLAGTLFFAADGGQGVELWRSDGTTPGTVLVSDIYPGASESGLPLSSSPEGLTAFDGTLVFSARTDQGRELWKSDGSAEGTVLVVEIYPGLTVWETANSSNPASFQVFSDALYFAATNEAGRELWKTDGTAEGTILVRDLTPGLDGAGNGRTSMVTHLQAHGEQLFLTANAGWGVELWSSDGSIQECDVHADCINHPGSFECVCKAGFSGDGTICMPVVP